MKKILTITLCLLAFAGCAKRNVTSGEADAPQMTGAYTKGRSVTKDELSLFNSTYKGEVALTPVSVATQVVAGTNYRFICKDRKGDRYQVVIYQKLPCYGGEAEVTSTEKL